MDLEAGHRVLTFHPRVRMSTARRYSASEPVYGGPLEVLEFPELPVLSNVSLRCVLRWLDALPEKPIEFREPNGL